MRYLFCILISLCTIIWLSDCTSKKVPHLISAEEAGINLFTSGIISRESCIRIQFSGPLPHLTPKLNKPLEHSPLAFKPPLEGNAFLLNNSTIVFCPAKRLTGGQMYEAELDLNYFDRNESRKFRFSFTAMNQSFELTADGLRTLHPDDLKWQQFSGRISTTDAELNNNVKRMLQAFQDDRKLQIIWTHDSSRQNHYFTIDSISRGEDSSLMRLLWDGSSISVNKQGEHLVTVPSIYSFNIDVVRPIQGTESHIEIRFSDPLSKKQNFNELISIPSKSDLRFSTDNNILRVYSLSGWAGVAPLRIEQNIRNSMGQQLPRAWSGSVQFEKAKPQVRFVGSGTIIPSTESLIIPVEAINVKAVVVEAIQIFDNTMPQFLQVNHLYGSAELKRVGRPVWKSMIRFFPTTNQHNQWIRQNLDLTPLIEKNPGGMYRLKLSFKRHHAIYQCPNHAPEPENEADSFVHKGVHEIIDGYSESGKENEFIDTAWFSERENPCHEAYYHPIGDHDISASRNILISNIGLIAKYGLNDTMHVIATDIRTTKPLPNVIIEILNFQLQPITSGKTDRLGTSVLTVQHTPYLAIARYGSQRGYLRLDKESSLPPNHFDGNRRAVGQEIQGFLYGERDIWSPGDTLFLTFMLYAPDRRIPANQLITLELYSPLNSQIKKIETHQSLNGVYCFRIPTDSSYQTGAWEVKVHVDSLIFRKELRLERNSTGLRDIRVSLKQELSGTSFPVTISADKRAYGIDELVTVSIPAGKNGRGLVSIENGKKVIQQEWVEGTSETVRYQFKATKDMVPNVYVTVTWLNNYHASGNSQPIRTYGTIPITILNQTTRLNPQLHFPDRLSAEEVSLIRISEVNGRAMTYTLAIIDEGLLNRTRTSPPDPWKHFCKHEPLGVRTFDLFHHVTKQFKDTEDKGVAVDPDESESEREKTGTESFSPMVHFYGPFELGKNKRNVHEIQLTQYSGTVRVVVVAADNGSYGTAERTAEVGR